MKGHVPAAPAPAQAKRRCLAGAVVLALLFFSLVVPLAVLLGLHTRLIPSVEDEVDQPISERRNTTFGRKHLVAWDRNQSNAGSRIGDLVERLATDIKKDWTKNSSHITLGRSSRSNNGIHSNTDGLATQHIPASRGSSYRKDNSSSTVENFELGLPGDENMKSCQLQYGSYCLWSMEHKVVVIDSTVKMLKDQLFVARAFYPSIAKLDRKEMLTLEMKANIQEYERMLSDAISDADLLSSSYGTKMEKMISAIDKAKSCKVDCPNVEKKFRQLLELTEDEANFHMKQSAFLYRLNVQALPRSFHCLSMRLTIDYFNSMDDSRQMDADRLRNPDLQHYVIFSTNLLATSITINSTVMNSAESEKMVFHLVTDGQNFYSFKSWFARNSYKQATIDTLNFDSYRLNHMDLVTLRLSPSEDFHITHRSTARSSKTLIETDYISVFGHSVFLLPDMFPDLKKVILLEDDVIVQRDLSRLWNINLEGNAISAVEFCRVRLGPLRPYLGKSTYNPHSCAWMSGLNIVDLGKWREVNVAGLHRNLLEKMSDGSEASWKASALPTSLLALYSLVLPLNRSWIQSGLGHDYDIAHGSIRKAAVLHYNGNRKPWLELGVHRYKKYWKKYQPQDDPFLLQCNVNP